MATESGTILIAEDERPLARALELKLKGAGFAVTVANDGQAAIDLLEKESYDLLLLDLIMPRVDGFGVLEWMSSHKKKVKVLVLSNLGQQEEIVRAKNLGAIDYFIKADTPLAEIVEKVRALL